MNYAIDLLKIEFGFMKLNLTTMIADAKKAPDRAPWADIQDLQIKIASLKEGIEKLSN
jgi:hypothetical protein